jgi:GMP synthase-like glutamine amidotransferase
VNIHILLHETFEGPGCIKYWAEDNGHNLSYTNMYNSNRALPHVNDFDFLVIMGGSMSVNDHQTRDWLPFEIEFIRQAMKQNKRILGVCLGSQLLASALGAKVYPAKTKEIGWHPVRFTDGARELSCFPDSTYFTVFHWHGETFDLPSGTQLLASSEISNNQGFMFGDKVVGLQFHFEVTKESIENLILNAQDDFDGSAFVQTPLEIRQGYLEHIQPNNNAMYNLLNYLADA